MIIIYYEDGCTQVVKPNWSMVDNTKISPKDIAAAIANGSKHTFEYRKL